MKGNIISNTWYTPIKFILFIVRIQTQNLHPVGSVVGCGSNYAKFP